MDFTAEAQRRRGTQNKTAISNPASGVAGHSGSARRGSRGECGLSAREHVAGPNGVHSRRCTECAGRQPYVTSASSARQADAGYRGRRAIRILLVSFLSVSASRR
jgi:hypothetical protein